MAVEWLDLEKIGIEANLVPKEAEFFVEQHIQNSPKSTSGKLLFLQFNLKTIITVKPVLSDHAWAKKRWSLNRGGLLIEVKMHGKAIIGT